MARGLEDAVLGELNEALTSGLDTILDHATAERLRREAEPEKWRRFHASMYERLPRWRWMKRGWHRARARHFAALVDATAIAAWHRCTGGGK